MNSKKKTSLIVGMGIGQLYKQVLTELGHEIVTVDPDISKNADFPDVKAAIISRAPFDTVHICTPNFTHEKLAYDLAPYASIIFIEKPGLKTKDDWLTMVYAFPQTRFIMVKNNMWRLNIKDFQGYASVSDSINLNWINKDRVPSPGSWFTNKNLSFGGVSRDLMPHLLSLYIALNPEYKSTTIKSKHAIKNWNLSDLENTDYGNVNKGGVYDVDDECVIQFESKNKVWNLTANWKSNTEDDRAIHFIGHPIELNIELGLCPEIAYKLMIEDCIKNLYNSDFWKQQLEYDIWIHEQVEKF